MALALTIYKNRSFYVDDTRIKVVHIPNYNTLNIEVGDKKEQVVLEDKYFELLPQVYIRSGHNPSAKSSKVLIDAPRNICIQRDTHYKNRSDNDGSYNKKTR